MPPSSRRPQRARREVVKDIGLADSSPSRPSKRRKTKTEDRIDDHNDLPELEVEPVKLPFNRKALDLSDEDLIAQIIPTLKVPDDAVQATKDHANLIHEKHSKQGVQAYAKLAGKDWTFYIKRLKNNIGRPPEGYVAPEPVEHANDIEDLSNEDPNMIHVDLGPSKMISRSHADITFDSDDERWNINVTGRNGVKIDNKPVKRGESKGLVSGEIIEISGVEMMFVLPQDDRTIRINKFYLRRAGLIAPHDGIGKDDDSEEEFVPPIQVRAQNGSNGPIPLAPAPPDYRRPGTPLGARSQSQYPIGKSPGYAGGTIFMNSDDVDLSLDSNQHIKPTYSYSQLISQAILDTDDEKLTLNGIYTFIMDKYAYYRHQLGGGWQNSIRHNLSLNKAFEKVARETNEPGKGMKWHIKDDLRDEMARMAVRGGRGGHRGSPASPGVLNRLSRGNLNSSAIRRNQRSPQTDSPPAPTYASSTIQHTPDQQAKNSEGIDNLPGDGSPLPRHRRSAASTMGLSNNVPKSPPVLSSSYLPDQEGPFFVTPAPHRVHPRLAPPSTAQRPSQHMPTSSPAPFWKYADFGTTPMKAIPFSSSPTKDGTGDILSSSPAPSKSPIRGAASSKQAAAEEEIDEEDKGIDLTRGFQSIGSFHAPPANALTSGTARI